MLEIIALVFTISAISYTITNSRIFQRPRDWIVRRTLNLETGEKGCLGELVTCPYCFSHWVSLVLALLYNVRIVNSGIGWIDLPVSALTLIMPANIVTQIFRLAGAQVALRTATLRTTVRQ